ncbi:MAG: tail fiber protein [Cellvibrionales bacterium]|nr:tail fiber protein [Cellvibrionales bacterium]
MNKTLSLITLTLALLGPLPNVMAFEPFIGQIIWVGFTFCPRGYTEANGQLLPINQNQALFSLYGTVYGGDGQTTFGLPDLRGRAPIHAGRGAGLSEIRQGQKLGAETTTLTVNQLPTHSHSAGTLSGHSIASNQPASTEIPEGNVLADGQRAAMYNEKPVDLSHEVSTANDSIVIDSGQTGTAGNNQAINIRSPQLAITACVALTGLFPSRS